MGDCILPLIRRGLLREVPPQEYGLLLDVLGHLSVSATLFGTYYLFGSPSCFVIGDLLSICQYPLFHTFTSPLHCTSRRSELLRWTNLDCWGLLHKIVHFETYLPVGTYMEVGMFCITKFAYINILNPKFVPTGRYASKRTILCNSPLSSLRGQKQKHDRRRRRAAPSISILPHLSSVSLSPSFILLIPCFALFIFPSPQSAPHTTYGSFTNKACVTRNVPRTEMVEKPPCNLLMCVADYPSGRVGEKFPI